MLSFADRLRRFGLSDAEADAFVVALEEGTATVSEIAAETELSRRYVYSVAESLADRGFVSLNEFASPTTVEARPPAAIFATLTEDFEALRTGIEARYHEAAVPANQFQVISLRSRLLSWLRQRIECATNEIVFAAPPPLFGDVLDDLTDAVERDVLVAVLLTGESVDGEWTALEPATSVARVWPVDTSIYFASDARHALVAPAPMGWREATGEHAVAFNDQEKVAPVLVGSLQGNHWLMGEQRHVTDPAPLPATFDHFRRAVLHAMLHEQRERTLRVTTEVKPAHTDESGTTLSGRLVGVEQGLVEPMTAQFPLQSSLRIRTDGEVVTVGGPAAFIEAYEVSGEIRLEAVED